MNRPLLDIAEGRDQDQRSDLLAAFRIIVGRHRRREIGDLHVRELLTYVLRIDRDGRGVQLSYDDVANLLACERSTARSVVRRAEQVFGLLAVFEDRYTRGGQAPNRYAIDFAVVRSTLSGEMPARQLMPEPPTIEQPPTPPDEVATHKTTHKNVTAATEVSPTPDGGRPGVTTVHPGVTRAQGAVTTAQPPATTVHPYKEYTLSLSLTLSAAAEAAAAEFADFDSDRWDEVARRAVLLARALQKMRISGDVPREFVWDVCAGAELLEPGMAAEWITRIAAGEIDKPRSFLDACMRDECQRRQLDWHMLRKHIPRPRRE